MLIHSDNAVECTIQNSPYAQFALVTLFGERLHLLGLLAEQLLTFCRTRDIRDLHQTMARRMRQFDRLDDDHLLHARPVLCRRAIEWEGGFMQGLGQQGCQTMVQGIVHSLLHARVQQLWKQGIERRPYGCRLGSAGGFGHPGVPQHNASVTIQNDHAHFTAVEDGVQR